MNWTRVPKEFRHGIVTGYKLYYKDGTISHAPWKYIVIPNRQNGSDVFSQNVTGLKIFTPYIFKVLAFTYKADGVFSENVTVWTDEFSKFKCQEVRVLLLYYFLNVTTLFCSFFYWLICCSTINVIIAY